MFLQACKNTLYIKSRATSSTCYVFLLILTFIVFDLHMYLYYILSHSWFRFISVFNLFNYCIFKSSRPKLTDLTRPPSQSVTAKSSSRPGSADHKQVTFASEEVVNELKQPPKYQGSRHVAHKEPPSPVTIVNMSPGVTKEIVRMDEHPSRGFRYAVVTPAIAKLPCKLSRTSDTNASKGKLTF